ncbi:MAG: acyltransferase [Solirubrobacterales bacterium]
MLPSASQTRLWWQKRQWYERNRKVVRRLRISLHMMRSEAFVRWPIEGEVLEALDEGRLTIGQHTLLEPGCWLTLSPTAEIHIGDGCFLNRNTMLAAQNEIRVGDHTMFANGCFVGDAAHRFDDPETPITWQGFTCKGPVSIGSNCWFGVNCVITSGVTVGDRCVVGANSVVTNDLPPRTIAAGAPAKVIREIDFKGDEQAVDVQRAEPGDGPGPPGLTGPQGPASGPTGP